MNSTQHFLSFYLRTVGLINACTFIGLIWMIVSRLPVNHVGFNPSWLWLVVLLGVGCWFAVWMHCERWALTAAASWTLLCLLLLIMNYYNLLVQYDEWLNRGMPDAWTIK